MTEKQKGVNQQKQLQAQVYRLEGIIIFCRDMLSPKEKTNDNSKT